MRRYDKIVNNPYSYGEPPSPNRPETPFSTMAGRQGVRALVYAGLIAATVDGPLPFGDAVAIAFWSIAGVALVSYAIIGAFDDAMDIMGK